MAGNGYRAVGRAAVAWMWMVAVVAALGVSAQSDAALVAAWNMNGISPGSTPILTASSGKGLIDLGGPGGLAGGASTLAGTTLGALEGDAAGDALSASGTAWNGTAMRIEVPTMGLQGLVLSFATRRSSTGFANCRIDCWDGLMWLPVQQFNPSSVAWEIVAVDLSGFAAVENGQASLRIVIDGATGSTGSVRFDNLIVSGSAVPAPGALALMGLAGLAARRGRRA
ncbi:MAG: hypothetical protein ACKOYN_12800 [Planctomycetota bacterium]